MFNNSRPSVDTYGEASMPCSPKRQLNWIKKYRKPVEKTSEELENYQRYLASHQTNIVLKGMPKAQVLRIKAKLNQKWLTNIMLKRKVAQISDELIENHE